MTAFFFIPIIALISQSPIEKHAPLMPSSPESHREVQGGEPLHRVLGSFPGQSIQSFGTEGDFTTTSVRGFRSSETAYFLEGIPLQSAALGTYDLGSLSPQMFSSVRLVRGGYTGYSTAPGGQFFFDLKQKKTSASIGVGSYNRRSVSLQIPVAAFDFLESDRDYTYRNSGTEFKRDHNHLARLNAAWFLTSDHWQSFVLLSHSDQQSPGPTTFPSYSDMRSTSPLFAFQWKGEKISTDHWMKFSDLQYNEASYSSGTRGLNTGHRLTLDYPYLNNLHSTTRAEWSLDKLWSSSFDSPYRHTVTVTHGLQWALTERDFILPQLRVEAVSDLHHAWSLHPSLGGRHQRGDFTHTWNFSLTSRAPNFNELYFDLPPTLLANPHLQRQQTIHGDLGTSYHWNDIEMGQSFFVYQTRDQLQPVVSSGISQVQNVGTAKAFGSESEILMNWRRLLSVSSSATWMWVKVDGHRQIYAPDFQWWLKPAVGDPDVIEVRMPMFYKSSVKTSLTGANRLSSQMNMGLQMMSRYRQWEFFASAENLLSSSLEDVEGYPHPHEPNFILELKKSF